jgi:hypothetical protein
MMIENGAHLMARFVGEDYERNILCQKQCD